MRPKLFRDAMRTTYFKSTQRRRRAFASTTAMLLWVQLGIVAQQTSVTPSPDASVQSPTSLTLPAALQMAFQHNRQITLAELATAESREKRSIARSHYYPQISNQSSASYLTDLQGVVIPAGALSSANGLIPSGTIRLGQGAQTAYTSGTGLIQPITQEFRIRAGAKAAEADLKISEFDEGDVKNTISLLVHKLYFDILVAQARLKSAEEAASAAEVSDQETNHDISAGRSLDVSSLESHADLLDRQQAALTEQLSIDDLARQFDNVIGLPLGTVVSLDSNALGDIPQLPSRQEAIATVVERNTKVLIARQEVEKAKAGLSATHSAYIPDISGFARQSYQSGVPFLLHNFGTFGGSVSFNLFDGGAREAEVKQAQIQLRIAETGLAQTQANESIAVSAAYDRIEQLSKLVAVTSEAVKAREGIAHVSDLRLEQNVELASATAKSHAAVDAAKASYLEARLGLFLAQRSAQQILGQLP
jgi:outer membrane protein TolC